MFFWYLIVFLLHFLILFCFLFEFLSIWLPFQISSCYSKVWKYRISWLLPYLWFSFYPKYLNIPCHNQFLFYSIEVLDLWGFLTFPILLSLNFQFIFKAHWSVSMLIVQDISLIFRVLRLLWRCRCLLREYPIKPFASRLSF